MKNIGILFLIALFSLGEVGAQSPQPLFSPEAGLPFIQNFSPKEYGGHSQNWAILQDRRGVMYFGNGSGVLEYDGISWRLIPVSNGTVVRSLAMDANGRIYVGAKGEFGFLSADESGQLHYVSLLPMVRPENRDFLDVWETHATSHGVYFRTQNCLFRWQADKQLKNNKTRLQPRWKTRGNMKVWLASTRFDKAFNIHERVYLAERDVGLFAVVDDSLRLVAPDNLLPKGRIDLLLPFPDAEGSRHSFLMNIRGQGLFLFDGALIRPFEVKGETAFPYEHRVLHGILLPHQNAKTENISIGPNFALATAERLVILNTQGDLIRRLDQDDGLRNERVRFIYPDQESALWLALDNGLARVEARGPFLLYGRRSGLDGSVNAIARKGDRLYVAGSDGVRFLSPPKVGQAPPQIEPVVELQNVNAWALLPVNADLLMGANGIFLLRQGTASKLSDLRTYTLTRSTYHPKLVFAAGAYGIVVLAKQTGDWHVLGVISDILGRIRGLLEEAPNVLWLATASRGFVRVQLPNPSILIAIEQRRPALNAKPFEITDAKLTYYGADSGIPNGHVRVYQVDGRIVFATNGGLKRFDAANNAFVPDTTFGGYLADPTRSVSRFVQDEDKWLWAKSTKNEIRETSIGIPGPDGYTWNHVPFQRVQDWGSVYTIYPDPAYSKTVWLGGPEGMLRYDGNVPKDYAVDFPALVRRVIAKGDSVIYGGVSVGLHKPVLPYRLSSLRFEYAATSYDDRANNRYQVFLQGYDDN